MEAPQPPQVVSIKKEAFQAQNAESSSDEDDIDDEKKRTLFIANLDRQVTDEILYEVFLQAGPIERVNIPKDSSGNPRNFGFVVFEDVTAAPYAMHLLQGLKLYGRNVCIKYFNSNRLPELKRMELEGCPDASPAEVAFNLEKYDLKIVKQEGSLASMSAAHSSSSSTQTFCETASASTSTDRPEREGAGEVRNWVYNRCDQPQNTDSSQRSYYNNNYNNNSNNNYGGRRNPFDSERRGGEQRSRNYDGGRRSGDNASSGDGGYSGGRGGPYHAQRSSKDDWTTNFGGRGIAESGKRKRHNRRERSDADGDHFQG